MTILVLILVLVLVLAAEIQVLPAVSFTTVKTLVMATEAAVRCVMITVPNKRKNSGQHSSSADKTSVTLQAALQITAVVFKASAQAFTILVLPAAVVPAVAAPAVPVDMVPIPVVTATAVFNPATPLRRTKIASMLVLTFVITI